jgi:hypothetical protein
MSDDVVNRPHWYTAHPSGVECIEICRELGFDLGNAFKYVWRHEHKDGVVALKKARWYLKDAHGREAPRALINVSEVMYKVLIFEVNTLKGETLYNIFKAAMNEGHERDSWIEEATYSLREMINGYADTAPR